MDDIAARGRRALLVGGTGLYLQAVVDDLQVPGRFAEVRADLDAEPDTAALHARLTALDPVAAGRMEPTNRRRVVRALEVTLGSGRPFSSYGPGLGAYPPSRFHLVGVRLPHDVVADRIEARYRAPDGRRLPRRGRAARSPTLGGCPAPPARRSATGSWRPTWRTAVPLDEALDLAVRRTRRFARRQASWFRRDPRIRWLDAPDDPATLLGALEAELAAVDGAGGAGETGPHAARRRAD